jgi:hypothetical protein
MESFKPRIVVSRFGEVADDAVNEIVSTMKECYERLSLYGVELVDLYVFERSSAVDAFLRAESVRVGVASHPSFGERFFSLHDAWQGTPRIIVCLERMKRLPPLARKGGVRHEVGHSILHGNPSYYMFPVPAALQNLARHFGLSRTYVTNMLYLISVAVKDYEVSRLLKNHGYIGCQIAFGKHILTPTEIDKMAWEMSKGRMEVEILCLVSQLKPIGYAAPFLLNVNTRKEMMTNLKQSLSFLPEEHLTTLLEKVPKMFQQLKSDTTNNVDKLTQLVVQKLIKPYFEDHDKNMGLMVV